MEISTSTILILLSIGLGAGMLSGFVGVGGGIVIVPALVFLVGLSQHEAQGTSLLVLMMPVVALSVFNYWQKGQVNWKFALIIASTFVVGGFIGSKIALKVNPAYVKIIFGALMLYISIKMMLSGYQSFQNDK